MTAEERARALIVIIDAHIAKGGWVTGSYVEEGILKSIKAAIAQEREACAKVAASFCQECENIGGANPTAHKIAQAIRARGN